MGSSPVAVASQGGAALEEQVEEKKTYVQASNYRDAWIAVESLLLPGSLSSLGISRWTAPGSRWASRPEDP